MMCCGAILLSRIRRLLFGATDPRFGACVEQYRLLDNNNYNQPIQVVGGILAEHSSKLLKDFFGSIRKEGKRNS